MTAYYNEIEPYAAAWLRNLVAANLIAPGDVDERSIVDVRPDDLKGYNQCHFFAGIAGWSCALRLVGWPDDEPVWTGSCPCQPLSVAGRRQGHADERHLWPAFFSLIAECRPSVCFGEQVASKDGLEWLAAVRTDLESIGYAVGAADLPAAGVGAPHIRHRLWFMGDANGNRARRTTPNSDRSESAIVAEHGRESGASLAPWRDGASRTMEHANSAAASRQRAIGVSLEPAQEAGRSGHANPWAGSQFIDCADGKARPVEPGIFPLAHGVSNRMGRLRAYGNAIVPQVAAEFIAAFMECRP